MGVALQNVSKEYDKIPVVRSISFDAKDGQILGLLGPNGAGKSTTLKMIAGSLRPTGGTVEVNGLDVIQQSLEVRSLVGYLPEDNPLYEEMHVHEYLGFVGKLYGLKGRKLKSAIGEVVEACGLTPEQNKTIGLLSKGFRQRVGIAQVLIQDPKVLILDEPTTGLDPNQILEVRTLIKDASASKTVILSTHILQEVQAICDKVVVMNKGEIVFDKEMSQIDASRESLESVFEEISASNKV